VAGHNRTFGPTACDFPCPQSRAANEESAARLPTGSPLFRRRPAGRFSGRIAGRENEMLCSTSTLWWQAPLRHSRPAVCAAMLGACGALRARHDSCHGARPWEGRLTAAPTTGPVFQIVCAKRFPRAETSSRAIVGPLIGDRQSAGNAKKPIRWCRHTVPKTPNEWCKGRRPSPPGDRP